MSKHKIQFDVESDAARAGFVKRRSGPDFRKISWYLKCAKCPRDFTAYWDAGMKPEAMMRHMRIRHWDVGYGMRPLCPDCVHSKDKGPLVKPDHQSFTPFVPPPTMIASQLMTAAAERSRKEVVNHKLERLLELELEVREAKTAHGIAVQNHDANAKLAAMQQRAQHAREMRLKRIAEEKAARAAGAEALRIAQLKERGCIPLPAPAFRIVKAPQAEEEPMINKPAISPAPKITHAVFQCLDGVFDPAKRLYRSGYTDQRVAKECGTSEDVVAYLRTETFGALAEDPRYSALRDDLELLHMESAETFAKLQKQVSELKSRVEQLAHAR